MHFLTYLVPIAMASIHKQLAIETVECFSFWCVHEAILAAITVVEHRTKVYLP